MVSVLIDDGSAKKAAIKDLIEAEIVAEDIPVAHAVAGLEFCVLCGKMERADLFIEISCGKHKVMRKCLMQYFEDIYSENIDKEKP
jgi:hypothetical protein